MPTSPTCFWREASPVIKRLPFGWRSEQADEICFVDEAAPDRVEAAEFFAKFRNLTVGGYYSTPQGMRDVGYVGNVPLSSFPGPPDEVLKKAGLL